jgi:hypothetical protein
MSSYEATQIRLARPAEEGTVSRRQVLKRGGLLAGAGAGALLAGGPLAAAANEASAPERGGSVQPASVLAGPDAGILELDVACDGNTFVINRSPGVDPDAPVRRGDPFLVNGRIYPAGTIDARLEGPRQAGGIGTWICRGWFYYGLEDIGAGAVPHVVTTQLYLLDDFDGLVSDGMEGGIQVLRVITGGYGRYSGARGHIIEDEVATNNTMLNLGGGVLSPAPNIKFLFHFAG